MAITIDDKKQIIYVLSRGRQKIFTKKRVGIYARISTARNKQTHSIDAQVSFLMDRVTANYEQVLGGIYVDIGSGRTAKTRAELRRLIDDCKSGTIDVIVTKSVSRFGRNTANTLSICRDLAKYNVDVYFDNEDIHSLAPDGELTMTLVAAIAEAESHDKSESVKWGIEKKAGDPDSSFFSRPCYGYRKNADGRLTIEETEAEVVRFIFENYNEGMSVLGIQRLLVEKGIPSPSGSAVWPKRTIEKLLTNEKYTGDVLLYKTFTDEYPSEKRIINTGQHDKLLAEDHHEPIITHEKFNAVQDEINRRKRKKM